MRVFFFLLFVAAAFLVAVILPLALTGQIQIPHH